jgi:hypothetical protein
MEDDKRIPTALRRNHARTALRLGMYGYVVIREMDDDNDALVRKVTPFQRRCILLYWVETNDGGTVDMLYFACYLGCEVRTIQYDLHWLEKQGYLSIEPTVDEHGATSVNKYHFIRGIESEFYDFKPTVKKVYGKGNALALREWHWDDYKDIPGAYDWYHNAFDKFQNYSELMSKRHKKRKIEDKRMTEIRPPFLKKPQK